MSGVEFDAALRQRRAKRARRGPHGPNSLDPRGGAKTIVVVEDNNDVLDLAVHYLTARGYRVVAARRGEKALRVLEDAGVRVDLLFRETVMPGEINGRLLAERDCRKVGDQLLQICRTAYTGILG